MSLLQIPSVLRNFITVRCSHFLGVAACFVAMVILLLHAQYACCTLEILYTNSSFLNSSSGIQFLCQCCPTLENKNQ